MPYINSPKNIDRAASIIQGAWRLYVISSAYLPIYDGYGSVIDRQEAEWLANSDYARSVLEEKGDGYDIGYAVNYVARRRLGL